MKRRDFCGLLGTACTLPALGAKKLPSSQKPAVAANPWLQVPFEDGLDQLPEYWQGHDLERLTRAALPLMVKDRFESEEQRSERQKALLDQVVYGRVRLNSKMVFRVPVVFDSLSLGRSLRCTYDVQAQAVRVSHTGDALWPGADSMAPVSELFAKSTLKQTGSYAGQNAYGAKVTVQQETLTIFRLVGGLSGFRSTYNSPVIALPASDARTLLPDLHALVIGPLMRPYVYVEQDHIAPTIKNPSDTTVVTHYLSMQVERIVVFGGSDRKMIYSGAVEDKLS